MIARNELMLGNWVQRIHAPYGMERSRGYEQIKKGSDIDNQTLQSSYLEPIPITPDILVKCGFTKGGFNNYNLSINPHDGGLMILSFSNDYLYIRQGKDGKESKDDDIVTIWNKDIISDFYLHQLQNLFHSITGKELLINFNDQ